MVERFADAVVFWGHGLIRQHLGSRSLAAPVFTCGPAIDLDRFHPSPSRRQTTRRKLGLPQDAVVVGSLGNIVPQKGLEYFVRAAARIAQQRPDVWFLIVGPQLATHRRYAAAIEDEVRMSGLPRERFVFAGERWDVEAMYPAMDIKLITSVPASEGIPQTAVEAMACGVPIVTTDVGAISEAVADGVTGFVVPPRKPAAIASAALRLVDSSTLRSRFAAEGRRAAMRYSVEAYAGVHAEAFDAAIHHHCGRPPRSV